MAMPTAARRHIGNEDQSIQPEDRLVGDDDPAGGVYGTGACGVDAVGEQWRNDGHCIGSAG
jgi:hypothetical protein